MKYSIFTPVYTKTEERTTNGQYVYTVKMEEHTTASNTLKGAIRQAEEEGIKHPIVGPAIKLVH